MKKMRKLCSMLTLLLSMVCFGQMVTDGRTLQSQLDQGKDISLRPGQVIEVSESLKFRKAGQRIETVGARTASEYARIVHREGSQGTLIEAKGIGGASLRKLILDGNRQGFRHPEGVLTKEPMLSFGGEGGIDQQVRNCIVIGSRSAGGWAAIHISEGGRGILIKDNIVFSSGADVRGNGRSLGEKPFGWGDGISTASRETTIVNNLIYDVSDDGVMVQGAPGTKVKGNVIVAISREMLGGIALIDPFGYYELDAKKRTYDYRGVVVEDNLILAMGGRVHVGLPMGGATWAQFLMGTTLQGATVRNNHISGAAGGYGYAANGIDGFEITGNTSDAIYSGLGDGLPGKPPDAPMAFMYNPATIGNSRIQSEFVPIKKSLTVLLRARRTPKDSRNLLGYRDQPYPEEEAGAAVKMAFVEMLGRDPQEDELKHWVKWLMETRSNADAIRCSLMTTSEFVQMHGYVDPLDLHTWRNDRWLKMILKTCSQFQVKGKDWPNARKWNEKLLKGLRN
ncbi:MAG: right-handed parallel beta-helix repeat-containing protein [Planctomycetes bacterium]|nr:right-handed parallel beta-helix repeat-containing protein [Planctomycetota bacterium]